MHGCAGRWERGGFGWGDRVINIEEFRRAMEMGMEMERRSCWHVIVGWESCR